jgi:hypothetical protein
MFSLCASFYSLFPISFSPFVISSLKKLRGRSADRRHCPVTAPRRRALPLVGARGAGAPYGARSPTGAPPRFLHRRTNATAQPQAALPRTWLKDGRYPSPPVPVQRASRRPVIVPAGRLPRAARERVTNPARGNRTRSVSGIVSRNALTRARLSLVTEEETYVNGKVTAVAAPFRPWVRVRKNSCSPRATGKCHHTNALIGP